MESPLRGSLQLHSTDTSGGVALPRPPHHSPAQLSRRLGVRRSERRVEDVREAQADLRAKALATLLKRAYDLGADDGAAGRDFLRADEIKDWKEVEESPDPDVAFSKLFEPFKTGFRKANSRQQKLFARVSEAGYADGKAGRRRDPAALVTPHEIQALVSSGINLPRFMSAVESDYADGYKKAEAARQGMKR